MRKNKIILAFFLVLILGTFVFIEQKVKSDKAYAAGSLGICSGWANCSNPQRTSNPPDKCPPTSDYKGTCGWDPGTNGCICRSCDTNCNIYNNNQFDCTKLSGCSWTPGGGPTDHPTVNPSITSGISSSPGPSSPPTVTSSPPGSCVNSYLLPTPNPQNPCPLKNFGDANCDGKVDNLDYQMWGEQFDQMIPAAPPNQNSNFACVEGNTNTYFVDLVDFEIWRRYTQNGLICTIPTSPTSSVTNSPTITQGGSSLTPAPTITPGGPTITLTSSNAVTITTGDDGTYKLQPGDKPRSKAQVQHEIDYINAHRDDYVKTGPSQGDTIRTILGDINKNDCAGDCRNPAING